MAISMWATLWTPLVNMQCCTTQKSTSGSIKHAMHNARIRVSSDKKFAWKPSIFIEFRKVEICLPKNISKHFFSISNSFGNSWPHLPKHVDYKEHILNWFRISFILCFYIHISFTEFYVSLFYFRSPSVGSPMLRIMGGSPSAPHRSEPQGWQGCCTWARDDCQVYITMPWTECYYTVMTIGVIREQPVFHMLLFQHAWMFNDSPIFDIPLTAVRGGLCCTSGRQNCARYSIF